jgi:hypothetical protein
LYRLEHCLLQLRDANEPAVLSVGEASKLAGEPLAVLRQCARQQGERIDAGAEVTSRKFLFQVRDLPESQLLKTLAEREGTVIRWRDGRIGLGPAAGEVSASDEIEPFQDEEFAPQLFRLYNLHCVATELNHGVNPGCRDVADEEPTS